MNSRRIQTRRFAAGALVVLVAGLVISVAGCGGGAAEKPSSNYYTGEMKPKDKPAMGGDSQSGK